MTFQIDTGLAKKATNVNRIGNHQPNLEAWFPNHSMGGTEMGKRDDADPDLKGKEYHYQLQTRMHIGCKIKHPTLHNPNPPPLLHRPGIS